MRELNEKEEPNVISEKKSSEDIFSDKAVTSLKRKWEKQSFDKGRRTRILRE